MKCFYGYNDGFLEFSSDEWHPDEFKETIPANGIHTTTNNVQNDKNTEAVSKISSSKPEDLSDINRIADSGKFSNPKPRIISDYSSPKLVIESFAPQLKLITYNESKFFIWSEINKLTCNFFLPKQSLCKYLNQETALMLHVHIH